ncbi:MAG: hypothetical protein IKL74_01870 [Clostridia bacterium]|nr:hypothetical protein [Clostridia bacterium]
MYTINSHEFEYNCLKSHKPLLRYEGGDFEEWKKKAKEKLADLLGFPYEKGACKAEIECKEEKDDHTEYRFLVETEPGYKVPCHLVVPKGDKEKYPLTICLSGHGGGMHVALGKAKCEADEKALSSWHHRAMAPRAIKEGRCGLVIEARSFGESSLKGYGTSCTEASKIAILMGRCTIGERVHDVSCILDAVAEAFSVVDMESIVCTGNSGGGTATFYLGCMDERIDFVAPSCSVCTYEASIAAMEHCMCNHIPYIRKYFEMGDLAGLIAPRKLCIAAGIEDSIFPIEGTKENFELVKKCYEASGAPENCALVVGDKGHLNYADLIWEKLYEMGL